MPCYYDRSTSRQNTSYASFTLFLIGLQLRLQGLNFCQQRNTHVSYSNVNQLNRRLNSKF